MDKLLVYEDHCSTVRQLRAAYNRIMNGLEGSTVHRDKGEQCAKLCDHLYAFHMTTTERIVAGLRAACEARDPGSMNKALQVLNRHSRSLARLTRLFQADIADYHPNFDDPNLVLRPVKEQTPIDVHVFLDKLTSLSDAIARGKRAK